MGLLELSTKYGPLLLLASVLLGIAHFWYNIYKNRQNIEIKYLGSQTFSICNKSKRPIPIDSVTVCVDSKDTFKHVEAFEVEIEYSKRPSLEVLKKPYILKPETKYRTSFPNADDFCSAFVGRNYIHLLVKTQIGKIFKSKDYSP